MYRSGIQIQYLFQMFATYLLLFFSETHQATSPSIAKMTSQMLVAKRSNEAGFSVANVLFAVCESQFWINFGSSKIEVFFQEGFGPFLLLVCIYIYIGLYNWIYTVYIICLWLGLPGFTFRSICVSLLKSKKQVYQSGAIIYVKLVNSWRKHFRSTDYQDPTCKQFGDLGSGLCWRNIPEQVYIKPAFPMVLLQ